MKKNILLKPILTAVMFVSLFSLSSVNAQLATNNSLSSETPKALLGIGIGFNDYGAGMSMEFPLAPKFSFFGNVGLGGWGWKIGGGFSFYTRQAPYNSGISVGYALASGLQDFETEMELSSGSTESIILDLYKVSTINLIYSYNLKVGKSSKFVFSGGYAICITSNPYDVQTPGVSLSTNSEQVLAMLQPGGVIFGIKFMYGF